VGTETPGDTGKPGGPSNPKAQNDLGAPGGPRSLNTPRDPGTLWSSLPTVNLGNPGGLANPFGPVRLGDSATSGARETLGERNPWDPRNLWGPRTSGNLEIFGCPISPGRPKSTHFLSFFYSYFFLDFPTCGIFINNFSFYFSF
jgi:hypothetical protein